VLLGKVVFMVGVFGCSFGSVLSTIYSDVRSACLRNHCAWYMLCRPKYSRTIRMCLGIII
jgi:L-cystine uptake protein TcyP (sodium:dicarboxylate symporter family)